MVSAEVLFASDLLKVRYCPQYLPPERIVERVPSLGYRAAEYTGRSERSDAERKDLLLRAGIAAFLWMNVMTFSLVVYASYFEPITASFGRYIPFLLMALATPAVFYCARSGAAHRLDGRAPPRAAHGDRCWRWGSCRPTDTAWRSAIRGDRHVYFDTACAIVTLVLAGKAIERGAKDKTTRALTLLYRLMPNKARVMAEGGRAVRLARRAAAGDRLPGEVGRAHSGRRRGAWRAGRTPTNRCSRANPRRDRKGPAIA